MSTILTFFSPLLLECKYMVHEEITKSSWWCLLLYWSSWILILYKTLKGSWVPILYCSINYQINVSFDCNTLLFPALFDLRYHHLTFSKTAVWPLQKCNWHDIKIYDYMSVVSVYLTFKICKCYNAQNQYFRLG